MEIINNNSMIFCYAVTRKWFQIRSADSPDWIKIELKEFGFISG